MTLPNFIIVGAAKAGTSSIFQYLVQHPQVFGCAVKEPSYFAFKDEIVNFTGPGDQAFNRSVVTKFEHYQSLFDGVVDEMAIGEASVVYLHNEKAPTRIKRYLPNAKIIAILRNPVDRAISSYSHLTRDGFEQLSSLSEALEAEEQRKKANWQHLWRYAELGFYFEALERYFSLFPRENIAIFTYDEFKENPGRLLKNIFKFFGVDDSFRPDTSYKYNVSGVPRSRLLHTFMQQPSLLKIIAKPLLPQALRMSMRMKVIEKNINPQSADVPVTTREYLRKMYYRDILNTQSLINKDLSAWME